MADKGANLSAGQVLNVNDRLVSNSGVFNAIMQSDGNFCVYRSDGSPLWSCSNQAQPVGQFYAIMQSDGNFCVYRSDGSPLWCCSNQTQPVGQFNAWIQDDGDFCVYSDKGHPVWCTGSTDPIVDFENITSIHYDLSNAKILSSSPAELYRQVVHNSTTQQQSSSISGSESIAELSGWSDALAVKVGASTSFKCGVPCLAEGKVTVSVDVTNTYTWNGSITKTKTWGFNVPVAVPPKSSMVCIVAVTVSTIAVPYTIALTAVLKSGAKVPAKITGVYSGSNSHDLEVSFVSLDNVSGEIIHTTQLVAQ